MLINYSYHRMQLKITRENILYLNGKRTALGVFVFFFPFSIHCRVNFTILSFHRERGERFHVESLSRWRGKTLEESLSAYLYKRHAVR